MEHFNASDAVSWTSCRRRAWYDLHMGDRALPPEKFDQLIMESGKTHEKLILQSLGEYVQATDSGHTKSLIAEKTRVIYQPVFDRDDLQLVAQPDFLLFEDGAYRVGDAKLAQRISKKKDIQIQLATYQIATDSQLPARAYLPGGVVEEVDDNAMKLAWSFLDDMKLLISMRRVPDADYVASKCTACAYRRSCIPQFEEDENLGLNYHIDKRSIPHLNNLGIDSLSDLESAPEEKLVDGPYFKGNRKTRAWMQARSYLSGEVIRVGDPTLPIGTPIHFDVETWPLRSDGKSDVYLWGFLVPPYDDRSYDYIWSDGSLTEDESAWREFLQKVEEYRTRFGNPMLVHYSNYEVTQIREYGQRYDDFDDDTVSWLLEDESALFDLRKSVLESMILPLAKYGLKDICKAESLVNFQWKLQESGSQWSVIRYLDYMKTNDPEERQAIKEELLIYNHDDVRATRELEIWLSQFIEE